jgi:orotidine-5'-phosphate decarboxylase
MMTPRQALTQGADFLVMGRAILNHSNPMKAIELIQKEIASV